MSGRVQVYKSIAFKAEVSLEQFVSRTKAMTMKRLVNSTAAIQLLAACWAFIHVTWQCPGLVNSIGYALTSHCT